MNTLQNIKNRFLAYCRYTRTVIIHKYNVFHAGLIIRAPLHRLIVHDWSKFLPSEFFAYAHNFELNTGGDQFDYAWNHHQKRNKHHWQYWVLHNDEDGVKALEMPEKYVREMVADWLGATKTYSGYFPETPKHWTWFQENIHDIKLHPNTKKLVLQIVRGAL